MCREYVEKYSKSKNIERIIMRRLQQLLHAKIVFQDDILYFSFKKHIFTGCIAQGGLIWQCTWQKPGEIPVGLFKHTVELGRQPYIRTFESLTDWTETCIQECLDEYHTRYSSWKRVRHKRSEQPMEVLFKHLQRRELPMNTTPEGSKQLLLFEQIASQKAHIEILTTHVNSWTTWFKQNHPDVELPVRPLTETTKTEETEQSIAQPFLLQSDEGQYLVLHRLNEVAPKECISWLKQNGPESFKHTLSDVKLCFDPCKEGSTRHTTDKEGCKRFVHQFFSNKN